MYIYICIYIYRSIGYNILIKCVNMLGILSQFTPPRNHTIARPAPRGSPAPPKPPSEVRHGVADVAIFRHEEWIKPMVNHQNLC